MPRAPKQETTEPGDAPAPAPVQTTPRTIHGQAFAVGALSEAGQAAYAKMRKAEAARDGSDMKPAYAEARTLALREALPEATDAEIADLHPWQMAALIGYANDAAQAEQPAPASTPEAG